MSANAYLQETELVEGATAWLTTRLPSKWHVGRGHGPDPTIEIQAPDGTSAICTVEARRSFLPRDAERLALGLAKRQGEAAPALVVAAWLSRRAQELLEAEQINFVDLTGNALIHLETPAVYIRTAGAERNPEPPPRAPASVRGPKAGRLLRLLADVRPPYGVRELATAAQLAPGYVSRLLDALDRDAIIDRNSKREVESVDVPALIHRWVESYDLLKSNGARRFVAPSGAASALQKLKSSEIPARVVVSGSFAAVRLAPVAGPALLVAYTDDVEGVAAALGLLPAEAANVLLLRPFDRVVWEYTTTADGVTYAAPSQVAADCLTGPGRMPAEGEALLGWMRENEPKWRLGSLSELVATSKGDGRA